MRLRIIHIGKSGSRETDALVATQYKKISRWAKLQEIIVPKIKVSSKSGVSDVKQKEGEALLKLLRPNDHVILCDEKGKVYDSKEWANQLSGHYSKSSSELVFVTGGAFGFSEEVYRRSNEMLSLSKMTFSHHLARIVLAEQLYRALTIMHNHPYHND